jgi:hypothetical protein
MPASDSDRDGSGAPRAPGYARWLWILPLVLTAAVYAPAFWAELVWDDIILIDQQLPRFVNFADPIKPSLDITASLTHYYRPIVIQSFMLDRAIFGGTAFGFHFSNVVFHVVTTFCVWLLARRLLRNEVHGALGALAVAVIFGVHPIHAESVSWVSGRTDVISSMLLIPSILLALYWRDRRAWWAPALGAGFFLLALLSKEVAIAGLILIPAALVLVPRDSAGADSADGPANDWRMGIGLAIAYLAALIVYVGLRFGARSVDIGMSPIDWIEKAELLIRSAGFYFYKVLVPWPQAIIVVTAMLPGLIVSGLLLLAGGGIAVFSVLRWRRNGEGLLLFAVIWFGVTLAPSLFIAISAYTATPVTERYLYLPSFAVALVLGMLVCHVLQSKKFKPAAWAVAALALAYAVSTVERGFVWQTPMSLWTDATKKGENLAFPWNQLGSAYVRQGDMDMALKMFLRSLEGEDDSVTHAWSNSHIGTIYVQAGRLQEAEKYLLAALRGWPTRPEAYWNLGNLYGLMMRAVPSGNGAMAARETYFGKAADHYKSAIRLGPGLEPVRWERAVLYAQSGEYLEAEGDRDRAFRRYQVARAGIDELVARNPAARDRQNVRSFANLLDSKLRTLGRP